ncbi:hypothetical protein J8J27_28305, partial [Mycobacterium tuberculosis]|nr:hypothetical protein [Mycobacterium tuberculosis]
MSGRVHLGLDVGGTATRWVAVGDDGRELRRGAAGGATGHVFHPTEQARFAAMLAAVAGEAGPVATAA